MKLALQIAVSYLGTEGQLDGTACDIVKMNAVLTEHLGYAPENITVLAEAEAYNPLTTGTMQPVNGPPTTDRIMTELIRLSKIANEDPTVVEVFIQYSGHGTYVRDTSASQDEDDGRDECLVPLDYETRGFIPDDKINAVLSLFPKRVTVIGLVDACHSGTMFDLPYRYITGDKFVIESKTSRVKCKCIMFSGCKDSQVSMDAYNLNNANEFSGAMSTSFMAGLKIYNYTIGVWQMMRHMWMFLKKRTFKQKPQVTTNVRLDRGTLLVNCGKTSPFIE